MYVYRYLLSALVLGWTITPAFAQWLPEQTIASTSRPDPEGSCARFPYSNTTVCVYEDGPNNNMSLYETASSNGGNSWSGGSPITFDAGDEYDPFLLADPGRNRLWLLYSKWGTPSGNDLVIRWKGCAFCPWSAPVNVLADGGNHWDASLLLLAGGHLLALESFESREGDPNGQIRSLRSTDGGPVGDRQR